MAIRDYLDPSNFDPGTSPGTDFYRHVNGGWLDANPVPPEYPAWGAAFEVHVRNEEILHDLLEQAAADDAEAGTPTRMVGDYFAAGMDEPRIAEVGVEPLRAVLDAIDSLEDASGLQDLMVELIPLGIGVFHGLDILSDFEDADRYLVYLSQGGLGLPERDYYLRDDERSTALTSAYVDHVTAQLANLGVGGGDEAEAIFDMEKQLAASSLPAEQHRDLERILNRHEVDSLDTLMPRFGLAGYVQRLGVTSPSVSIDHAEFFATVDQVMTETPIETIRHYLKWHVVRRFATALPPSFEEESFDFYNRKLGGQQRPRERWTRVLSAAAGDIGELVARLYVDTAFSPEAKERCEHMVDGLIEAMARSIRSRDWMSEETKKAALAKVEAFTYKIGYPDEWRDYSGLEIDRSSYVENRMRSARFEFQRNMGRLDQPVDKREWVLPAHVVNAYYNPLLNEVVFPAGILQPPFFYADADDAVNYGGIGSIIGHEITHGFDDNGSRFDEQGRRRNWWTENDRAEFERRAEVVVEQFSRYLIDDTQSVNGRLTLGENIADLGGLKIAFDAFLDTSPDATLGGFNPIQRFFLAYATIWRMNYTDEYLRMLVNVDVHAPNQFRANGPLSNFPPFAEAFGVEEGLPMRRSEVAEIW